MLGAKPKRVMGFVEAMQGEVAFLDRDFIHAARLLLDAPVARQRQPEALQEDDSIDAVVADEDHGLAAVMVQDVL